MTGRDPSLVWFASEERILERDELARLIDQWRRQRKAMTDRAAWWWTCVDRGLIRLDETKAAW